MSVRAKFKVIEKTQNEPWSFTDDTREVPNFTPTRVKLAPVYAPKDGKNSENAVFGEATPNGTIEMLIQNDAAAAQFEIGKAYHVDFTPAT